MKLTMANLRDPFHYSRILVGCPNIEKLPPPPLHCRIKCIVCERAFSYFLSKNLAKVKVFFIRKDVERWGYFLCETNTLLHNMWILSTRAFNQIFYALFYMIKMKFRNLEEQKPIGHQMETKIYHEWFTHSIHSFPLKLTLTMTIAMLNTSLKLACPP